MSRLAFPMKAISNGNKVPIRLCVLWLVAVTAFAASGCLTRAGGPTLPFVKPARSVPEVDSTQLHLVSRIDSMETELQRLRDQVERLQASGASRDDMMELRRRVAYIERLMGIEVPRTNRPSYPGSTRGETSHQPGSTGSQPPGQSGRSAAVSRDSQPAVGQEQHPATIPQEALPDDERDFREVYALVTTGSFAAAIPLLEAFLKSHPKSPLTSKAVYWLGESYLATGRPNEAVLQFDRVIKQHPGSDKLVSALLKQGQAFHKMGDIESARIIFKKLIAEHPHTVQARAARSALKSLPKGAPQTGTDSSAPSPVKP